MNLKRVQLAVIFTFCLSCQESSESSYETPQDKGVTNTESNSNSERQQQSANNQAEESQDALYFVIPGDSESYDINEELQLIATEIDRLSTGDQEEEGLNLAIRFTNIFKRKKTVAPSVPKNNEISPGARTTPTTRQTPVPQEDVVGPLPSFSPQTPRQYKRRPATSAAGEPKSTKITPHPDWRPFSFPLTSGRTTVSRNADSWTVTSDGIASVRYDVKVYDEFGPDLFPPRTGRTGAESFESSSVIALKDVPGYNYHRNIIDDANEQVVEFYGRRMFVEKLDGFPGPDGSSYTLVRLSTFD